GINGLSCAGARVDIANARCRRNGQAGIIVYDGSRYTEINNVSCIANGNGTGTGYGLRIYADNVVVNGGTYMGVDTEGFAYGVDLNTLTKHHLANIAVEATASNVRINQPYEAFNSSGRGIQVNGTPLNIIINQTPTEAGLVPGSSGFFGSPGSTVIKTDATDASQRMFIKMTGSSSTDGIWRRVCGSQELSVSASATLTGQADIVKATISGGVDTVLTLPSVSTMVGLSFTIVRASAGGNNVTIQRAESDTIDGGSVPIQLTAFRATVTLLATATGWRTVQYAGAVTF
ncbi:MAG TPA: hypothetical protein VIH30_03810, partial [Aquirhabdus sp.]